MRFVSQKILKPVLNYLVYNKELIVIIEAFNEWRPYLSRIEELVDVFIDYKNLRYFKTKELNLK